MVVVTALNKRDVSRNSCTSWQWLYWIKLFSAITFELKTLQSLLSNQNMDLLRGTAW